MTSMERLDVAMASRVLVAENAALRAGQPVLARHVTEKKTLSFFTKEGVGLVESSDVLKSGHWRTEQVAGGADVKVGAVRRNNQVPSMEVRKIAFALVAEKNARARGDAQIAMVQGKDGLVPMYTTSGIEAYMTGRAMEMAPGKVPASWGVTLDKTDNDTRYAVESCAARLAGRLPEPREAFDLRVQSENDRPHAQYYDAP